MISAIFSWIFFLVILFAGLAKETGTVNEYACVVKKFYVEPRFECYKRCSILNDDVESDVESDSSALSADDAFEIMSELERTGQGLSEEEFVRLLEFIEAQEMETDTSKYPDCDELELDTLEYYSPRLCLEAKWGFEDPLCPPESATCYAGDKWRRKCTLSCPLAFNVYLGLDVDHIGHVEKMRDLGTDADRYRSYKEAYHVGDNTSCQVAKDKVLWIDERISHRAMRWWKWSVFAASILFVLGTTTGSIVSYVTYNRNGNSEEDDAARGRYAPVAAQ